jgi:hypothetical protein
MNMIYVLLELLFKILLQLSGKITALDILSTSYACDGSMIMARSSNIGWKGRTVVCI